MMKYYIYTIILLCANIILYGYDAPVINEVMHNAPQGERWIEIHNPSPFPYPLNDWRLEIAGSKFETVFIFPDITLLPRAYIIIGEHGIDFADYIAVLNLTNEDEVCGVRLVDANDIYQDTVIYGFENPHGLADDVHNPATAFVTPAPTGCTIARNPNGYDTNNISDWDIAERPTPAAENFVYYDLAIGEIYVSYESNNHTLHTVIHDLSTHNVDKNLLVLTIILNSIILYEDTPNISFYDTIAVFDFQITLLHNTSNIIKVQISYPHDVDNSNNSQIIEYWYGNKPFIINELQYAPISPEPEWIEFFNPNDEPSFVENAYFTDSAGRISVFSAYLEPADYFIVTQSINNLLFIHPHLDIDKIYQPSNWATLVNTRDTVELFLENGAKVDSMSYVGVNSMRGRSLERVNPWSNDDIQWVYSTSAGGSTPLAKNSQTPAEVELQILSVEILEQNGYAEHRVEITNRGYINTFEANLYLYYRNENEVEYTLLDDIYIFTTGDYYFSSPSPIEKGYHYYMYKLSHEKENDVVSKSILNERPPVVVNEIMFNPYTGEPIWIEFTQTRPAMPLAGLKFFARTDSIHIPYFEGEYALLTVNSSDSLYIRQNYDVPADVPIFLRLRSLLNAGMQFVLKDYDDNIYEDFSYIQSYSPRRGISAERISPILPPEDQNWTASLDTSTPGRKNTVQMSIIPTTSSLEIENSPFSPHRNEHCFIKITVKDQQVRADIKIFDLKGREIIKLADKQVIPGEYVFIWNGFDRNNRPVSPGVYPVYVNIESGAGSRLLQERKLIYDS